MLRLKVSQKHNRSSSQCYTNTAPPASITHLEASTHWTILSASASPATTLTMTYKSQLQLFFHPGAFSPTSSTTTTTTNAPISLTYISSSPEELPTTLRFFLQLLRASLQALPQPSTRIPDLLRLVSSGWETALRVAESERRLSLETLTTTRIVSDERVVVEGDVLLPRVRTKVRVGFEVGAAVSSGVYEEGKGALELGTREIGRAHV